MISEYFSKPTMIGAILFDYLKNIENSNPRWAKKKGSLQLGLLSRK